MGVGAHARVRVCVRARMCACMCACWQGLRGSARLPYFPWEVGMCVDGCMLHVAHVVLFIFGACFWVEGGTTMRVELCPVAYPPARHAALACSAKLVLLTNI